MAYDKNQLSVLTYANGFTLWHYKTADTAATVDSADYFLAAKDQVRVGDLIIRTTFTDGTFATVSTMGFHFVNSNTGSAVDVADALVVTATDTD